MKLNELVQFMDLVNVDVIDIAEFDEECKSVLLVSDDRLERILGYAPELGEREVEGVYTHVPGHAKIQLNDGERYQRYIDELLEIDACDDRLFGEDHKEDTMVDNRSMFEKLYNDQLAEIKALEASDPGYQFWCDEEYIGRYDALEYLRYKKEGIDNDFTREWEGAEFEWK